MAPSLAELRRSYWWACRYLDSLYRDGTMREYHTRTPFTQIAWKKIGEIWYPLMFPHPAGYGIPRGFTECIPPPIGIPMQWWAFSKFHNEWSYVHNTTRDYTIIARLGFEDMEPDKYICSPAGSICYNPLGDSNIPLWEPDHDEPKLIVEYTRNRLKNGFFNFRHYYNDSPEKDLPTHWGVGYTPTGAWPENTSMGLSTDSYLGPYSLFVWYKGVKEPFIRTVDIHQVVDDVLPDTEYVLSMYFKGKVNYNSVVLSASFYDRDYNYISRVAKMLDYGEYNDWQDCELRFRTPNNAYRIEVELTVWEYSEPWPYSETTIYFDAFWLSECPVNLNPYYRLMAQVESYGGERKVDIWESITDTRIWTGISSGNIPRSIFEKQISLDGVPAFRSAIRHSVQNCVFYYKYSSMHPEWQKRAEALQAFRDKYGYTTDIYHVLWRETDNYPDDFMYRWDSVHDCDAWYNEPVTRTFYPYWSKMCQCRGLSNSPTCGYRLALWFGAIEGMHVLNKYGDAYKEINFLPYPVGPCETGVVYNPRWIAKGMIDCLTPNKGYNVNWPSQPEIYAPYANGVILAFLSELGYGFREQLEAHGEGDLAEKFRWWTDNLASTLIGQQWLGGEGEPPGLYRHEDFGEVNIPEFAGGFCVLVVYKHVDYVPVSYATSRKEWFTIFADFFGMPTETPGIVACNQEATFCCLRGLQIYEWYKFKGGKGAFPKLLMPADVDGDGWVSELDLAKVQLCKDHGFYDPLCDINMDGVVDDKDVNLVKANLGRGTPRRGVIWTPTISDRVQVGVYRKV
jgi:hypothetical protein